MGKKKYKILNEADLLHCWREVSSIKQPMVVTVKTEKKHDTHESTSHERRAENDGVRHPETETQD